VVSAAEFGARPDADANSAIQQALDHLALRGGGVLRIGANYRAGNLIVRGSRITIDGAGGTLRDVRFNIVPEAKNIVIQDLNLLETRGKSESYLLDVSGTDCVFRNPMAGGYQAYLRADSRRCSFMKLTLEGSNGIFVAGRDHLFEDFVLTSTLRSDMGGDDAFAIKAPGVVTENIVIRNGIVRGYSAAVSIGSEVGSSGEHKGIGVVRRIRVDNVFADRCQMVCFIKPGALIYDWRDGAVEDVVIQDITLSDPEGFMFTRGIALSAGRGARISGVKMRNIVINARARSQGVMPTAAVDISIRREPPGAIIEDVQIQAVYDGSGQYAYPVDHVVRIEKDDEAIGTMRELSIDVAGNDARIAGIYVGPGLDDAVTITRARLTKVTLRPPSSIGAAGIWADSRVRLGDVEVQAIDGPTRGGRFR
jgi:hypothetical protein